MSTPVAAIKEGRKRNGEQTRQNDVIAVAAKTNNREQCELTTLKDERDLLQDKLVMETQEFREVLIFCKHTMKLQDDEIRRIEELVERQESVNERILVQVQEQARAEAKHLQNQLDRMRRENKLMLTQLDNQQQLELEMEKMNLEMEELRRELASKDEKMNRRELREREIALITEQRVREEVEKEFANEIGKIERELKIQNAAQIEANNQIITKLKKTIEHQKIDKEQLKLELNNKTEELTHLKKEISLMDNDKRRLEEHLQRAGQQAEKLLKDSKRQLEESEAARNKETTRHIEIVSDLRKQLSLSRKQIHKEQSELAKQTQALAEEKAQRTQTLAKHADQNAKLLDLQRFLKLILEDNNDDYVDAMLGENRIAFFSKLSLLLDRIPTVQ